MRTLEDLFIHELKDLHSAEKQLSKALPRLLDTAQDEKLKATLHYHVVQNSSHIEQLAQVGSKLKTNLDGVKCKAMEGLIKECEDMMIEDADSEVKDAGLIGCIQRIEHYKIAGYGTARHYAKRLDHPSVAEKLEAILTEEKSSDDTYNDLAIERINVSAM